ncbi:hypothetical protein VD659_09875 [Herbiconiux sp. 11R-BC]|uniref:hypothetical protein n=1 Tax=Herbiconiux sp. 11R-BC TaxID=3111637 RepID=UPI003C03990F
MTDIRRDGLGNVYVAGVTPGGRRRPVVTVSKLDNDGAVVQSTSFRARTNHARALLAIASRPSPAAYVVMTDDGTVRSLDGLEEDRQTTASAGMRPSAVVVDHDSTLLVADAHGDCIWRLDPVTKDLALFAELPRQSMPRSIAMMGEEGAVVTTDSRHGAVLLRQPSGTLTVLRSGPESAHADAGRPIVVPTWLAATSGRIVVAAGEQLLRLDPSSGTVAGIGAAAVRVDQSIGADGRIIALHYSGELELVDVFADDA